MPGASGSDGPVPRGLINISAGFFLRPPDCAARRVVKLMGGGGKEWTIGLLCGFDDGSAATCEEPWGTGCWLGTMSGGGLSI